MAKKKASDEGHSSAEWARVYRAARPKRMIGGIAPGASPESSIGVIKDNAREAEREDELAWQRDLAAEARDHFAERRDRAMEERERALGSVEAALAHAASLRAQAAVERTQAADDRRQAARDRLRAADERAEALAALETAHLDDLTGAYRRGVGEHALLNEVERAHRTGEALVLVLLDVDGLRTVNNEEGHLAGDRLLCDVVASIQANIRSYEPIVRLGGDEFAFIIGGIDLEGAGARISLMRADLARRPSQGRFKVGVGELRPDDELEHLIARADAALVEAGGHRGPTLR